MMASSGRLGLYKILKSNKTVAQYLPETILFSRELFPGFIERYEQILIQPVFGNKQWVVLKENNVYKVQTKSFSQVEKLMNYLQEQFAYRYYTMQPHLYNTENDVVITLHRKRETNNWKLQVAKIKMKKIRREAIKIANKVAVLLGRKFYNCYTVVIKFSHDKNGELWIQDTHLHFQKSKWNQFHSLSQKHSLLPYIPATEYLTLNTFKDFLEKYDEVIIKPCDGKEGDGIAQIVRSGKSFEIHHGVKKMMKKTVRDLYDFVDENFLSKNEYIIQQRIALATINKNPIDVRVIIQKQKGNWSTTGKLVKVAGTGFIITNASQKLLQFEEAMVQSTIESCYWDILQSKVEALCISAAKQLEKYDPDIKIIGFDIGITNQGEVWIIEGNYRPNCSMFKSADEEVYSKILKAMRE